MTIPHTWTPYIRDDDGELLGYLVGGDGAVQATTLFGYPLGAPGDEAAAERVLDSIGLSYLADRWLLTLPDRREPIAVQIVEASPQHLTVKSVYYSYEGDYGTPFTLDVPVAVESLRPERAL